MTLHETVRDERTVTTLPLSQCDMRGSTTPHSPRNAHQTSTGHKNHVKVHCCRYIIMNMCSTCASDDQITII